VSDTAPVGSRVSVSPPLVAEIVITVADVDDAVAFYTETVGLDYVRRVRVDDTSMVLLAAGPTRVALVPGSAPSVRIAFASDDVAADHRRLGRRGVATPVDPTAARGGVVLPFSDPWGNPLAFWEVSG
jgi:catechol 2,3-dioxygenase-like lactoylglutathione lyase family enzyme